MNPLFLDTVGLIALWDESDQWHAEAAAAFETVFRQGRSLMSTTLVLFECGNASARRPYRSDVCDLRRSLAGEGWLVEPTPAEIEEAWAAYERCEAGQAGIFDHVSFQVMRRLGLTEAFTNDRHFAAAGFRVQF